MGWLFSHRSKEQLLRELLQHRPPSRVTGKSAHSIVGNELWTVVKLTLHVAGLINGNLKGDSHSFINLDLLDVSNGYWGSQSISESMGPYYYGCPLNFSTWPPSE
jgi:hypothetical protein